MRKHPLYIFVLIFVFGASISACQTGNPSPDSSTEESKIETIAILGTNDLHGALNAIKREIPNSDEPPLRAGGVAMLSSYVKQLKKEFGSRLLWLDAGDQFQGTLESNLLKGEPVVEFYNRLGLNAAAIGNHEFDYGIPTLENRMKQANYPYLAANILSKKTKKPAEFPKSKTSMIIQAGDLRVGVFGLSTIETPWTTRSTHVEPFQFESLKEAALRESESLRNQGAQIVVLVAHAGLVCGKGTTLTSHLLRRPSDIQGECTQKSEIVELLNSLPKNTIDAVVSGHTHTVIHHWINGIPVIQGKANAEYINILYLSYDWQKQKLVPEQTRIEGPVAICDRIFRNQKNCDLQESVPPRGRGPLVPPRFHGHTMKADPKILDWLKPIMQKTQPTRKKMLGTAETSLEHPRYAESEMGNLVADAIRFRVNADFSLVNPGYIRTSLPKGPITYGEVYRALPFDNVISSLKVNGDELKLILQIAQNGSRGFHSVSGLQLKLIDPQFRAPFVDLTGDGIFEFWKTNRILQIKTEDGKPIQKDMLYNLATLDFLAGGGDQLGWIMEQIPKDRIVFDTGIIAREAVVNYIQKRREIDGPKNSLVSSLKPRIELSKPKKEVKKKPQPKAKKKVRANPKPKNP